MKNQILCDIDGTLLHHGEPRDRQMRGEIGEEEKNRMVLTLLDPITPVVDWLWKARNLGYIITYVSGRPLTQEQLDLAIKTLWTLGVPPGLVFLRPVDMNPTQSKMAIAQHRNTDDIAWAIDDDPTTVWVYRELFNIPAIQVPGWDVGSDMNPEAVDLPELEDLS